MSDPQDPPRLILVSVSATETFHETIARVVAPIGDVRAQVDAALVHDILKTERVHGLLIDARLPEHETSALAEAFLQTQPTGRAILLASDHGTATLRRLCTRDPRVALFFTPWNRQEVQECLQGRRAPVLQS